MKLKEIACKVWGRICGKIKLTDWRNTVTALILLLAVGFAMGFAQPLIGMATQSQAAAAEGERSSVVYRDPFDPAFRSLAILKRFGLSYVSADKVKPIAATLEIPVKVITVDVNPRAIWAHGTEDSLDRFEELINILDRPENQDVMSLQYKTITTTYISPVRMVEILNDMGLVPNRYVVVKNKLYVFDEEIVYRWSQVMSILKEMDIPDAADQTVFVYQLKYTTAKDTAERLETAFPDVRTVTFNYPELSREMVVLCPPHMSPEVTKTLSVLDGFRQKIRLPVDSRKGDLAVEKLMAIRVLIKELVDVPVGSMYISENLSADSEEPWHVLWVEETPEKIKQIEDLLDQLNKSSEG